ncbi:hypothetical protein FNZ56_00665 [Pseudoluteimonas lycopersici]|uniref:Uncharacterized protein n=1 Tax=Pseudoluteimonas lycopersici TaxID=1324796 RepID=A0A516V1W9_9GAMM|nr:hypothetical protein [Lysobacter lycopersici]QDQ72500.1 hypothetical protein FNZ56_00665 [Lysobacter lycopersici]
MKTCTRILFLSLAVSALAACAGTQDKSTLSSATRVEAPSNLTVDDAYVARVEYMARQRGVEVHWVNMPTKHRTTSQ